MEHKRIKLPNPRDRISALPEPIIHHILSFLPHKDVKITSLVSKTWYYHICPSFPFLDFDFDDLQWPVNRFFKPNKYLKYVGQTLRRFHNHNDINLDIQRLNLKIPFTPFLPELLNSWMSLVLQREIHELNLDIRFKGGDDNHRPDCYYDLPQPVVFAAKSIKVAKLGGCSLLQTFHKDHLISGSTCCLLKLRLHNVLLDDQILRSIISTFPLIEELSIASCIGINRFQISNLSKLKSLQISHDSAKEEPVEIDAPSLQSLDIHGSVKIRALKCPKLIDLDLNEIVWDKFGFRDIQLILSYIRSLRWENLPLLGRLKMSNDNLKKLTIIGCQKLVELKVNAPNLCSLKGDHFSIASSMRNVSCVKCHWSGYESKVNPITVEDFLVVVRNLFSKASHLKNLNLILTIIKPISFEELNKTAVQPVVNIDHLTLWVVSAVFRINYPDTLDCVLWSCHPRTLSFHSPYKYDVMSIFEVIAGHRLRPCKLSRRSWLHCLEEVKYVAGDGSEGQLPMNGIFLASSHISSYREIKLVFKW